MGWLKERIDRERMIREGLPLLWSSLTASIATAVAEWGSAGKGGVNFNSINPKAVRVWREDRSDYRDIELNEDDLQVFCRSSSGETHYLGFDIVHGSDICFAMDGKPVGVEMACRLLIEPLFFLITSTL